MQDERLATLRHRFVLYTLLGTGDFCFHLFYMSNLLQYPVHRALALQAL
jgi:hypothetical protein